MNFLTQSKRAHKNKDLRVWSTSFTSSNNISFFSFQMIQISTKEHPYTFSFATFLASIHANLKEYNHLRTTLPTLHQKRRRQAYIRPLSQHNKEGCGQVILLSLYTNNIYSPMSILSSLTNPTSESSSKLIPKQKTPSHWNQYIPNKIYRKMFQSP